jgi:uroporphyrinogen-III synthase
MGNLKNLRILNIRPAGQNTSLSEIIRAWGGISIECPSLAIEPVLHDWALTLGDLATFNQAVFISVNAVRFFFEGLRKAHLEWPAKIQAIAIGEATHAALIEWGVEAALLPLKATSEGVLALEDLQQVVERRIMLVKGVGGRTLLAEKLRERGAAVVTIDVYRRALPVFDDLFIQRLWRDDAIDMIIFTSEEAMNNLFIMFGQAAQGWLKSKSCLVTSERLARVAANLGMKKIILETHGFSNTQKG